MVAAPPVQEELTAAGLEALIFSEISSSSIPSESIPSTKSASLSTSSITTDPTLRHILTSLHHALHSAPSLLPFALNALHPLVLTALPRRTLIALGAVPLFLTTAYNSVATPSHAISALHCLNATLCDPLAARQMVDCNAPQSLLRLLHHALTPARPHLLAAVCAVLSACITRLPTHSTAILRSGPSISHLRQTLDLARRAADDLLACRCLAVSTAILTIPCTTPTVLVQTLVRELRFSDVVLRLLTSTSDLGVRRAALLFLRPALDDNVDSVEAFGRVRGGEGLSHILRIASDLVAAPDDEEELMAVCHIICVLCHVRANFDRLVCRGLTNALVKLVPHLSFSATSATIALELLDRCVAASEREAKKAFAEPAATGVISCIQTNRHNASVQEAGMMLLMSVIDMFDLNREIACKAKAPQVVHFALTEHAKDARVVAAACRVLIRFSAFDILSAELGINELIMLLRSRLKMHRSDGDTSIALLELIEALELVPPRTVELIRTFREQNTSESSMSRHSDMNSQTLGPRTMSGSLRKSFHRRLRHGSGKWLERGRRVHSDFGVEDSFQRARRDDVQGHPKHSGQSFRMRRKSKGYERTSGERLFRRLSGLSKSSEPGEDGRKEATEPTSGGYHLALKASEPLIRLLTNSREDVSGRDYRVRRPMVPMVQKELGSACAFRHERQLSLLERKTLPNERPMQISAFDNNNIGPVVIEKKGNGVVDNGLSYTEAKEYWKPLGRSGDEKRHSTWCHSWKVEDVLPSPVLSFNAVESGHEESDEDSLEDHSCFSLSDSETGSRNGALDNGEDRASIGVNEDAEGDVFGGDCYDAPPELDDDVIKQRKVKKASSDARTKVTKEIESVESCSPCTNSGSGDMDMRSEDEAEFGEEQFPNLTPGPLYSENVMRIGADCDTPIHMDSGFDHNDLLSRAKIFGERERKPESLARISGAWGRPNWSIWPFNSAEDPVELRSFPARFHPRGESGSLRMRR